MTKAKYKVLDTLFLDERKEREIRSELLSHYRAGNSRVDSYVNDLMDTQPFIERFNYLFSVIGPKLFTESSRFFCSGFSLGSELIAARRFGFKYIFGVEVDLFLVSTAQKRLSYLDDMHLIYYGGNYLPFADEQFDVIASGHVIEHTGSPEIYLRECLRVLRPGGVINLEFPNRFHWKELHTGLPSFEWLPRVIRNRMIWLISSKISPLSAESKTRYTSIVTTGLQQISIGGIRKMMSESGYSCKIVGIQRPVPGFIRAVIQKGA